MSSEGLGYFGDVRRQATGEELLDRIVATGSLVLRQLGGGRAGEMRFQRFLASDAVSVDEILATAGARTAEACRGRRVLAIQDTTEVNFGRQRRRTGELGPGGDGRAPGFFIHSTIAVDRDEDALLGAVDAQIWTRSARKSKHERRRRAYGEKESARWQASMEVAAERLPTAQQVIMVADREADIFTPFAERPAGMDMVVRAAQDRQLADGGHLRAAPEDGPVLGERAVDVAPRGPGDRGRRAQVELRAGRVRLARPVSATPASQAEAVELTLVRVYEPEPPAGKR